ncbi:MAG: hypothetical protein Q9202_006431 [Teloschistes flavicans]
MSQHPPLFFPTTPSAQPHPAAKKRTTPTTTTAFIPTLKGTLGKEKTQPERTGVRTPGGVRGRKKSPPAYRGVNAFRRDVSSSRPAASAAVVREAARTPSSSRMTRRGCGASSGAMDTGSGKKISGRVVRGRSTMGTARFRDDEGRGRGQGRRGGGEDASPSRRVVERREARHKITAPSSTSPSRAAHAAEKKKEHTTLPHRTEPAARESGTTREDRKAGAAQRDGKKAGVASAGTLVSNLAQPKGKGTNQKKRMPNSPALPHSHSLPQSASASSRPKTKDPSASSGTRAKETTHLHNTEAEAEAKSPRTAGHKHPRISDTK